MHEFALVQLFTSNPIVASANLASYVKGSITYYNILVIDHFNDIDMVEYCYSFHPEHFFFFLFIAFKIFSFLRY